jgi:hypothetical protein
MLITINDPVSGQRIVLSPERKIASVIKIRIPFTNMLANQQTVDGERLEVLTRT